MKCDNCLALICFENDCDCYCGVGESIYEFADGSLGCHRRSKEKLDRDFKRECDFIQKVFAEECKQFVEYVERVEGGGI